MADVEVRNFPLEFLRDFSKCVFIHFGVPEKDAILAASVLDASDRRGIDSHGVARLHTYFELLTEGRINPTPDISIVRETPSTATVDGDNGLGLVVGPWANEIAMEKAQEHDSGWVSVCNSNHFGIAGYYVLEALTRDLIGIAMTNSTKIVAPLWGAERMLGTNPIAIAFPGKKEPPIVIDMATSTVAFGKVEIAWRSAQPVPDGWISTAKPLTGAGRGCTSKTATRCVTHILAATTSTPSAWAGRARVSHWSMRGRWPTRRFTSWATSTLSHGL